MQLQDQAIVVGLAQWTLDVLLPETPHLTLITADGAEHVFAREGRAGTPMTLPAKWVFAKWERAVQFASRNAALAKQPAFTVTTEHAEDQVPEYVPDSEWSSLRRESPWS